MFKPQELQSKINFKNQPNTIEATDFPIHSLAKDLARLNQDPNYDPSDFSGEQEELINKQTQDQMTDKQKTSPFLNQSQPEEIAQNPENPAVPVEKQEAIAEMPEPGIDESGDSTPLIQKTSFKIMLIALLAVLLVFALVFIVYYYKNTNSSNNSATPNEATPTQGEAEEGFSFPIAETSPDDTASIISQEDISSTTESSKDDTRKEEAEPIFSLDKPNFLIIEESEDREASLKKYIKDMSSMEQGALVEFIPVDSSYNPLAFKDFYSLLKINLPDNITALVDSEKQFSFLLYNDGTSVKLNLAIPIKNNSSIAEEMKKWEPAMTQDLNSLIVPGGNAVLTNDFGESTYAETLIRYKNMSSDGSTAIDYFLKNKLLVLATSKNATLGILNNESLLKN